MVKAYDTQAFDVGVKRTSGVTVGMMLTHDKNDVPNYAVFDDEYLASQFFTGEPGYANLPAEKELAIRQSSWRSGFGLDTYDPSDPERYLASNGMDMRHRGMMIAGPIATGIATNEYAGAAITNPNMETATSGWSVGGARSAVQYHAGAYSWAVTANNSNQILTWNAAFQSKKVKFWCWVYSASVDNARISIWDGIDYTYSSFHTGDSTWQLLSVEKTLAANASNLGLYLHSVTNVAYFDDAGVTSLGFPLKGINFNNVHYIPIGQALYKLNGTGDGFTLVKGFGSAITSLQVFGSNLFVFLGLTETSQYMDTSEAWAVSTATVNAFKYNAQVNAATPVLWANDSANTIRSNTNPINGGAAWSGVTTIASDSDDITGMYSDAGSLYITKEDMPYYLDSTGAVKNDLAPELATIARSTDNGKSAFWWQGKFYLPYDTSLLEYDGGVNTWRSPNDFSTQLADFVGKVFAVAGDDRYLFAIIDNSTKIEVLAGRLEVIDGTTKWVWHPINETTLTGCEAAWVTSVYQRRLWISSTSSSDSLYYIPLPVAYGNVLADANRSFLTSTTMETSWLHGNFRSTTKAYIQLTLEMGHTYDADIYFTVKYKKLGDSSWTTIGNYTGSATSMTQSRYIPVDASSNNPKSALFKLQFTAVTDDTTKTPVLLNYNLKAVLYPDQREIIAMKVYCSNNITLRDTGEDSGSYDTIIATLDEARTATYPITIYDLDGTARTGKFLPLPGGTPRWRPLANEKERKFEREYNLLFQLITVS